MSLDKERLRRLVREGRLSAVEAAQIGQALERLERRERRAEREPPRRARASEAGELKARFLGGEIDADQYRAASRELGVRMGLCFGALMLPVLWAIGPCVLLLNEGALAALVVAPFGGLVALPSAVLSGLAFGLVMYHWQLAPAANKLAALQGEVDLGAVPLERTRPGQCRRFSLCSSVQGAIRTP